MRLHVINPKRPKAQQSAGTIMASVFWDAHIHYHYLEKGKTINSDYYTVLLNRLKAEIMKKRPHMAIGFTKTMHHVTSQ